MVWLSSSAKVTRLALKPPVLTLERLLPATSSIRWCADSPETPARSALFMVFPLPSRADQSLTDRMFSKPTAASPTIRHTSPSTTSTRSTRPETAACASPS